VRDGENQRRCVQPNPPQPTRPHIPDPFYPNTQWVCCFYCSLRVGIVQTRWARIGWPNRPKLARTDPCPALLSTTHWIAIKRVLRYLNVSHNHGLYNTKCNLLLNTLCDSDWIGCPDDRLSTSRYAIFPRDCLIA
jgi:hypothetical protein